ncbi:histidine phosphatase family protein [Polaromonas sp. YR568]|uniref:histidine phosphatase family protein n=1 Tax=Polaromonas sp. YR568 TaxID=1855301 RepID=UPI003137A823
MQRRPLLILPFAALATPWAAQSQTSPTAAPDVVGLLRAGGCVLMLRHAQTDPGIGDPPGFSLAQCSSQRNLSAQGRSQASAIGQWFRGHGLQPRQVLSSAWCRCKDTADLAFGRHTVLPALASTFNTSTDGSQTRVLRGLLKTIPAGQFDVWVTHQVNISALSGGYPAMGEGFVLGPDATIRGRTLFA